MFCNIRGKNTWLVFVIAAFMLFSMLTFSIPAAQAEDAGLDTTVPGWTYGVLDVSNITENSLTLTWLGASDDTAVTGYKIYQESELLAELGDVATYNVTGLSPDTEYTFTVQAVDAAANESTTGPSKIVTTAAAPLVSPVLTADSTDNSMGKSVDVTFTDDAAWRKAITGLSVDGTVLTIDQYTITAGNINLVSSVFNAIKSYTIVISATGYPDASVVQEMLDPIAHAASFTGNHIVTNLDINANGLNMTVAPAAGYHFDADKQITPEIKAALIDSMVFDSNYGLIDQNTGAVEKADSEKTNLANINNIWTMYFAKTKVSQVGLRDTVIARLRTYDATQDDNHKLFTWYSNEEYLSDRGRFLAAELAVKEELKAIGTVTINADGNLVISCDNNGYLKNFTNVIRLVNGGMKFIFGDLPISLTVPAELVKEGVPVKTTNTFDILEVKAHIEIWQYMDDSRAGEAGVVAVNTIYDNGSTSVYTPPYAKAHYIKQVTGDVLTEADVRSGGTLGPNGTGNKLIKVVIDGRTGPTWWAFKKPDPKFVYNVFRTNITVDNYTLAADAQTPQDDPEWLKIENEILQGGAAEGAWNGFNTTNKYLFNTSGDNRCDEYDVHDMWYMYEVPTIADYDITEDQIVYVNQLCGMTGGSGGGGANPQGVPFWGMDGRCSFTIDADADLTAYNATLAAVVEADYTTESWIAYQAVVTANVMTEGNTQAEVNAATEAITAAQANLVFAGQADLDKAKAAAAAKVETEYTTESWTVLKNALALPETTNAEVVAKTTAINEAIAALKTKGTNGGNGGSGGGGSTPAGTKVSTQGGTVSAGGITLTVPAGAQANSVYVEIKKLTSASNLPVTEQQKLASDVFELTKNVTTNFSKAVTIKISFDKSKFDTDKYDLAICWFDTSSNKWVALDNCKVDLSEGTVSGGVSHFTKFAVIAVKKAEVDAPVTALSDISTHWAKDYISTLVQSGAISGYPDASFKPDNNITRAEFATVLVKAYRLPVAAGKTFNDADSHWAADYIATAYAAGIINGYSDSSFGPDDPITREQIAVMIAKAAKIDTTSTESTFTDSSQASAWAKDALNAVTQAGIMKGYPDGTFNPQGKATRAETAAVIVNALK